MGTSWSRASGRPSERSRSKAEILRGLRLAPLLHCRGDIIASLGEILGKHDRDELYVGFQPEEQGLDHGRNLRGVFQVDDDVPPTVAIYRGEVRGLGLQVCQHPAHLLAKLGVPQQVIAVLGWEMEPNEKPHVSLHRLRSSVQERQRALGKRLGLSPLEQSQRCFQMALTPLPVACLRETTTKLEVRLAQLQRGTDFLGMAHTPRKEFRGSVSFSGKEG